jgi:cobalt/nickel transport system permease protein
MKHNFHLFFDFFSRQDHWARRLDVRVKMGIAAVLFGVVLGSTHCLLPMLLCLIAFLGLCFLSIPLRIVVARFLPSLIVAFVILVLQALVTGQTVTCAWAFGSWTLVLKQEGLELGFLQASRILGAVGILLLLGSLAPAHELFLGLRWCRFPKVWVEIALLMYRYLFVFLDEASELLDAQRIRLGYGRTRTAIVSAGSLLGAVMVRSIEQSMRTHEAMIARGYTGDYPFGQLKKMAKSDYGVFVFALLLIFCLYFGIEKEVILW